MTNTRKFSRVPFRVNATIKTADRQFYGNVENLSMSGMFLCTAERLPEGEPVEITIVLSGTSPELFVGFTGRVSRETENGIAFSFEKIDLDSYTHLKNIIAYNSEDAEQVMEEIYHSIDEKLTEEK
ncbi:MAG: PilZ domain-containing protein [Oryzomonas sp.]|uniref:PilZ domain-containing protein n=1 Tax=Oryzomonas sp. TaxID=2855186 RepID=UPI00283E55F2|nr:PilZ domain-containing protein [Oryzomonas sp.]MDR3579177.1 PilZ domain-containing protein [Oryzomonas sp.]